MRLDVTRIEDPETGQVHAAWSYARETICGQSRTYWPAPSTTWSHGVDCDACVAGFMAMAVEEAASYIGRPMRQRKKRTAVAA
jgi:hypothetical protein